ncbi:MAG: (4Fe-4S)-binding protein [Actinomycetota bacterium]|nr:(4Fe-4S)-binding protein [Actinomycetota bacterium]
MPPKEIRKEYSNDSITVVWEPKYCIHSTKCLRALPGVFDFNARPWISVDAAAADDIANAVSQCPSGALHFERHDGGPAEEPQPEMTVTERPNGPLYVRGKIRVLSAEGDVLREDTRMVLCRCGQSANKPFCDGTHTRVGFRTDDN